MAQNSGVLVIAPIVTPDSADTFPTHLANMGQGGIHSVPDTAARDAISTERRVAGMLCYVQGIGFYQLSDDLSTWTLFTGGGGGGSVQGGTTTITFGMVSPTNVFAVPAGQAVDRVTVEVTAVWDGVGATVTLGSASVDDVYSTDELPLQELALYDKDIYLAGPAIIRAYISPGATPTTGAIRVQVSTVAA